MPLPNNALVLVADGRKMLVLPQPRRRKSDRPSHRGARRARGPRRTARSRRTLPGRRKQSAGYGRSTYEETDFQQQEEDRWIKDAADDLKARVLRNDFDALAIVAPPKALGDPARKPPQGSREADRLHSQQGNERPPDPRHRGTAQRPNQAGRTPDRLSALVRRKGRSLRHRQRTGRGAMCGGNAAGRARSKQGARFFGRELQHLRGAANSLRKLELAGVDALQVAMASRLARPCGHPPAFRALSGAHIRSQLPRAPPRSGVLKNRDASTSGKARTSITR